MLRFDELIVTSSTTRPIYGMLEMGISQRKLTFTMSIREFCDSSQVVNEEYLVNKEGDGFSKSKITQRPLDPKHAAGIASYVLRGLVSRKELDTVSGISLNRLNEIRHEFGTQPYFDLPPFICNWVELDKRGQLKPLGRNMFEAQWTPGDMLRVIDGQHRREAFRLLMNWLGEVLSQRVYPKGTGFYQPKGERSLDMHDYQIWQAVHSSLNDVTLTVNAHASLSVLEERQLFHDHNNTAKTVQKSISFDFDSGCPLNAYVKQLVDGERPFKLRAGVVERDQSDWSRCQGTLERKHLVGVNARLFLNKTSAKNVSPELIETHASLADCFWMAVNRIRGFGSEGAKLKTVAAQPVVLKGIASLVNEIGVRGGRSGEAKALLDQIASTVNFSHRNPIWDVFNLSQADKRAFPGLTKYLPSTAGGENRDIGARDAHGRMRFAPRHNDIAPIIADLIRYKIGMDPRTRRTTKSRKRK